MFKKEKILQCIAFALIIIAIFFSYNLYTKFFVTVIKNDLGTDLSNIAGAIGGAIGPIIAIAAVIITYLAFIKQNETNILVRQQFEKEQIYSRFYELLKLHTEIVSKSDLNYKLIDKKDQFKELLDQFNTIYKIVEHSYNTRINKEVEEEVKRAPEAVCLKNKIIKDTYYLLFFGIDNFYRKLISLSKENNLKNTQYATFLKEYNHHISLEIEIINKFDKKNSFVANILDIGDSHDSFLSKYYRHLYSIVKYVVQSKILTYQEKRELLKVLRSQLSNEEQVLLYYNWLAGFGGKWELVCNLKSVENRFFTDFIMIHNLREDLILFKDLHPLIVFDDDKKKFLYLDQSDRELFEVIDNFESSLNLKQLRQESCKRNEKISNLSFFCQCHEYM